MDNFVFRTLDLKESRQILGPISNFNPLINLRLGGNEKNNDEE
jgi:hypothetical protein